MGATLTVGHSVEEAAKGKAWLAAVQPYWRRTDLWDIGVSFIESPHYDNTFIADHPLREEARIELWKLVNEACANDRYPLFDFPRHSDALGGGGKREELRLARPSWPPEADASPPESDESKEETAAVAAAADGDGAAERGVATAATVTEPVDTDEAAGVKQKGD
uniref:Uncharacterized protein n=1 Tax=Bicosoecida sp. CB-2014 TaxID=1486930 RepID=A0A7S1C493_9STRA|mmetsp:Transcript_10547/g.36815  ORF Transcript_10547/g.36815 Transcript_10547/m.36815 type:complete len:164 (+) Transcript_10547:166-657(+)